MPKSIILIFLNIGSDLCTETDYFDHCARLTPSVSSGGTRTNSITSNVPQPEGLGAVRLNIIMYFKVSYSYRISFLYSNYLSYALLYLSKIMCVYNNIICCTNEH